MALKKPGPGEKLSIKDAESNCVKKKAFCVIVIIFLFIIYYIYLLFYLLFCYYHWLMIIFKSPALRSNFHGFIKHCTLIKM